MKDMVPEEAYKFSRMGQEVFSQIENSKKFYIAAVNGFALGGGCELALACDMRVGVEKSKFSIPEVSLGVVPGFGGTQRLPRIIGLGRAKEFLARGTMVDGAEAYRIGLLNHLAEDNLIEKCEEIAKDILKNSPYAIGEGKRAMNMSVDLDLDKGLEAEALIFAKLFAHHDQKEGMGAFVEKRKANFK